MCIRDSEYCLYKRDSIPQNNPANAKFKPVSYTHLDVYKRQGLHGWLASPAGGHLSLSLPSSVLKIKRLESADATACAQWDAFVLGCPQATFFHRAGWQKVVHEVFRHSTYFLYAELDERIIGVLHLAHVNSLLFGNALTSLPFAVYGLSLIHI